MTHIIFRKFLCGEVCAFFLEHLWLILWTEDPGVAGPNLVLQKLKKEKIFLGQKRRKMEKPN